MTANSTATTSAATSNATWKLGDEEGQGVADAAQCRHRPADDAAQKRMTAAAQYAVIGKRLRKAHAHARARPRRPARR